MQYMILLHTEPFEAPAPGEPGFEDYLAPWLEFNRGLADRGALVASGELESPETATTVRRAFGAGDMIVDGPFAETKEVLAGFYIVEAADLDEALAIAGALPMPAGAFEVRPLARLNAI